MTPATLLDQTFHIVRLAALDRAATHQQRIRIAAMHVPTLTALCPDSAALEAVQALPMPPVDDWDAWEDLNTDYERHITHRLVGQWSARILAHVTAKTWQPETTDPDTGHRDRSHHNGAASHR